MTSERQWGDVGTKLLFENHRVRIWELALEPGVVVPQHSLELLADQAPSTSEALQDIEGLRRWRVREFGAEWLAVLADE